MRPAKWASFFDYRSKSTCIEKIWHFHNKNPFENGLFLMTFRPRANYGTKVVLVLQSRSAQSVVHTVKSGISSKVCGFYVTHLHFKYLRFWHYLSVARKKVEKKLATKHYEPPSFSYFFHMVYSSCHAGCLLDARMSSSANFSRVHIIVWAPIEVAFFTKQNAWYIND